ncbi:uncharacterized protein PV06_03630 [Exophiala oligosperma]|uniref:Heterokaryon incompatibility domain-containing protein n=1 Tax=Exophiala oligosperma TaxID=215243 RepID=A0A0D2DQQ8_9EURO|nr:uncharacterized protein PV06_03630 [Exophiala oligosperma]KIW45228.1 hypothetical protein PV06_03630 [Exophiala oligosperma]
MAGKATSKGREEQANPYTSLCLPDDQSIRVLTLQPGGPKDPLIGALDFAHLESAGVYQALSYVWGDPNARHSIFLGTAELEITTSLYEALKRIRDPKKSRRVWADQICINQKDRAERSQQVKFMNMIYKNADHVLVWLGLDEENLAAKAFDLIHRLDEALNKHQEKHSKPSVEYVKGLENQIEKEGRALDCLTDLPWFKRGWIVQEIGTKAPATMFWGGSEIDWETLHGVCERLTDFHHLRSKLNIRTSDIKYVFQRFIEPDQKSYHANRFNFIYELHRARGLQLTDALDRVFAWLGHYSVRGKNQQLAMLEAKYDKSVAEVYTDVAKRSLLGENDEATGSALIALAAVQHKSLPSAKTRDDESDVHETARTADNDDKLPTWVPDWRRSNQSFILSEPIVPHRAHGTSSPEIDIMRDKPILKIGGVIFDRVKWCSRLLRAKEFHPRPVREEPVREEAELAIDYLWREGCDQGGQFDLSVRYPNGQEALFALMQTLSNGCVQIAGREGKAYRDIPCSRWLEQQAAYLAKVFDLSSCSSCPKLHRLAEEAAKGDEHHEGEQWSRAANGASKNRKFARTDSGYYVLGPEVMEETDIICVLFGGKMPFCLRPWNSHYLLVGECYVHGLMDGEAMEMLRQGLIPQETFEIV